MRRGYIYLLVSLTSLFSSPVHSVASGVEKRNLLSTDSLLSFRSSKGYVPTLLHNFGEQFTSPLRMKPRQWMMLGAVAGATVFLIHYDKTIDDFFRPVKSESGFVNATSPHVSELGNNYSYALVACYGLSGLIAKDRKILHTALLASQAMITSGVWVRLVKYSTSRERPQASYTVKGHPGGYWYGFFKEFYPDIRKGKDVSYFDAFPSGHTSTAFAIATVFAMQYAGVKAVPVIAYSLASIVGITRMTEHTHWASDVFVGAWAGYLCGRQVVQHHRKIFQSGDTENISSTKKFRPEILISPADQFTGLKVNMVF